MSSNNNLGPIVSGNAYIKSSLCPHMNQFKVAHLNCRSISPSANSFKLDELRSILSGNLFDVFAISETWLNREILNQAVGIAGYKFCRNDRPYPSRGGGVGIYISNKIKFKVVFKVMKSGCESLFLELLLSGKKVLVGVVYLPSGQLSKFERYHRDLFSKYSNIVVIGDFNCNLFNATKSRLFRSLCLRCNMSVVHNSRPTHFDLGKRTTSLIDFFLVSNVSMIEFSDQVQCPSISDHALIFGSVVFNVERFQEYLEYRDFKNINWNGLFQFLNEFNLSQIFYAIDIDIKCSLVCSLFENLYSFVPIVRVRVQNKDDTWMKSNEIVLARSLRDLSFSAFQDDRSFQNWSAYCKLRNRAKNVIRKAKRKHYSKMFNGLDTSGFWRIIRGSGCIGTDETEFECDADTINSHFVHSSSSQQDINFDYFYDSGNLFSFCCINEFDLFEALNKVKSSSVGVDGIPIKFIKLVFPYISQVVLHLVNTILTSSKFPMAWKSARVVPIPKTRVVHGPDDLRPISILPALSKVVEHILRDQILNSASVKICNSQYGFRKGYNTTSLLLRLTDSIRSNINDDKLSVLISLDLSKAFNSVDFAGMILKLRDKFKFSKSACKLILSYLSGRSQFVVVNGVESDVLPLFCGVPQGSVLGPLLFLLYVNDLPEVTNTATSEAFLFADDVFLLFKGNRRFPEVFEHNINIRLENIMQWTTENFLAINSSKTKAMMFGPTNRFFLNLDVFLGNDQIQFVSQHKCLGVILDSKLSFGPHIDALAGKIWGSLRKLYRTNIFLPLHTKQRLSHAILMSQVLYGLELVSGTINFNLMKLKRIVNAIVRFVYYVKPRDHISDYVRRFLGCSFNNFVKFRNLILFHKVMKNGRPSAICESFLFSSFNRNPHFVPPRIVRSAFERSFMVRIPRYWNILPYSLRIFSQSNNVFRLKLLEYFSGLNY